MLLLRGAVVSWEASFSDQGELARESRSLLLHPLVRSKWLLSSRPLLWQVAPFPKEGLGVLVECSFLSKTGKVWEICCVSLNLFREYEVVSFFSLSYSTTTVRMNACPKTPDRHRDCGQQRSSLPQKKRREWGETSKIRKETNRKKSKISAFWHLPASNDGRLGIHNYLKLKASQRPKFLSVYVLQAHDGVSDTNQRKGMGAVHKSPPTFV